VFHVSVLPRWQQGLAEVCCVLFSAIQQYLLTIQQNLLTIQQNLLFKFKLSANLALQYNFFEFDKNGF
jgi:hypothetical protein